MKKTENQERVLCPKCRQQVYVNRKTNKETALSQHQLFRCSARNKNPEQTNYVGTTTQIQDAARALMRELGGSENVGNVVIWNTGDHADPIIQSKYSVPPPPPAPPPPTISGLVRALVGKLVDAADAPFHSLGISYDTATDKFTLRWLSASEMNLPNATEENYENLKNLSAKVFANAMYGKLGRKD